MGKFFDGFYTVVQRHRLLSGLVLLMVIIALTWSASRLKLGEDISTVLPESENLDHMGFVMTNSRFLDRVIFHFRLTDSLAGPDPERLSSAADQLSDSLLKNEVPQWVRSIDKAPDQEQMMELYDVAASNLPVWLQEDDYRHLDSITSRHAIAEALRADRDALMSPMGLGAKKMIKSDPLHLNMKPLDVLRKFSARDDFTLYNRYFLSADRRHLLLMITPVAGNNTQSNQKLFERIGQYVQAITNRYEDKVSVTWFGNPVVALGNAQRIKNDIMLTVTLALVALMILITWVFRRKRTFFLVFLPALFGALFSLGIIGLFRGSMSAISLGIGSVLLGISVDYALHIYSHFRQNQEKANLYSDLVTPILLSSLTTASAFFTLLLVNSVALNDLGLFAGLSVLGAALFSLLVLPHFLTGKALDREIRITFIDKLASFDLSRKKGLGWVVVLITILMAALMGRVGFDDDMMKSNYMSPELRKAESDLNAVTALSKKTIYLVSTAADMDEALTVNAGVQKKLDSLKASGVVEHATVINEVLPDPETQRLRLDRWKNYWSDNLDSLKVRMEDEAVRAGFKKEAFDGFLASLEKDHYPLVAGDPGMLNELMLDNYLIQNDSIAAIVNIVKVDNRTDAIDAVYDTFDSDPKVWVIDKRRITSDFIQILKDNFNRLVWMSLTVVFVLLLLAYGRIELTLITMIPMVLSWIWTVGIMGLLGISFNIFNVIILTFIFGLGIDYSIFLVRGYLQEYKYGRLDLSSYKVSILLSGITTLLGIGVLILARHPALRSIALMSIIGIVSVVFITFTMLPRLLRWLLYYPGGKRTRPITALDLLFSLWALFVFVTGSLFLSLLSLILPLIPIGDHRRERIIHGLLQRLTHFMLYMNFLSRKTIVNPQNEDFSRPAIVIANHQSHVDLMMLMLLTPKLVILTNSRNFRSPIYGHALKYAGFIEAAGDYDQVMEEVRKQISKGYSVAIYPEGHRSDSGEIRRFHQGAFYLAGALDLDILPIVLAGQRECLKKKEFFLKRGRLVTRFLPRVRLSDGSMGSTPREQAKQMRRYMADAYALTMEGLETPDFLSDFIRKNYLYKGPVLEWYTRIKLRLEENYSFFDGLIPDDARIADLGCGYGYLSHMLAMRSKKRIITAVDYDGQKIAVAANCAITAPGLTFIAADITEFPIPVSDVIVLGDVLHYLPVDQQVELLRRCAEALSDTGFMIIREADSGLQRRHMGTVITEFFSTNLGFNKTRYRLEFVSRDLLIRTAQQLGLQLDIIDQTIRTSNLVYLMKKKKTV